MLYEFAEINELGDRVPGGEIIERPYPASQCPPVGQVIQHAGRRFARIISIPASTQPLAYDDHYPVISRALPQYCDGAEHVKEGRHQGRAIITSRKHKDQLCRMHGYTRDLDL